MHKTIKVLLIIAVVGAMVQVSYLISSLFDSLSPFGSSNYDLDTLRRVLVYWFSGAIGALAAIFLWGKERILALAIGSGGVYLMFLGANGGLWTREMVWFRLILAIVNFVFFLIILKRINAESERL